MNRQNTASTIRYRDGFSLAFSSPPRRVQLITHRSSTTRRYIRCADKKESLTKQRLFEIVAADVIMNSSTDAEKNKEVEVIMFSAKNSIRLLTGVL